LGKVVHAGLEYYYRHRQRDVTLFSNIVIEQMMSHWESMAEGEVIRF
jgi:hypothetical protein